MRDKLSSLEIAEMFKSRKFDNERLAETFPPMSRYFLGTKLGTILDENFKEYENGVIISEIQMNDIFSPKRPPKFIYLPKGDIEYNNGNHAIMKFLMGNLEWYTNTTDFRIPEQYEKIQIPAFKVLKLNAKEPSFLIREDLEN